MSKQAAVDFLAKLDSDPKIRQAVLKSVDQVVGEGAQHGFSFSSAELKEAMAEKWKMGPSEPSEGGVVCAAYCTLRD
jgi:hypothetical protein